MLQAVVDLGFGDAGKGMLVHHLVRRGGAGTVTVRFNGGAQAGHTVVDEVGRRHVFAQFGAGTLAGAPSVFASTCVFDPLALMREAHALAQLGAPGVPLWVSSECMVVTPYAQACNRLRERARGKLRHGSCGVGVGETVRMSEALGAAGTVRAWMLGAPAELMRVLAVQRAYVQEQVRVLEAQVGARSALGAANEAGPAGMVGAAGTAGARGTRLGAVDDVDLRVLATSGWWSAWCREVARVEAAGYIVDEVKLAHQMRAARHLVFEGAQGILLDEHIGFAPHTTPSTCTLANVHQLVGEWGIVNDLTALGVVRSFMVRHGAGPLPTESAAVSAAVAAADATNQHNAWQGTPRAGVLDLPLLRYACRAVPELVGLAVSHCDTWARAAQVEPALRAIATSYAEADVIHGLAAPRRTTYPLDPFTARLATATPQVRPLATNETPATALAADVGLPLLVRGAGASAAKWADVDHHELSLARGSAA